MEVERAKAGNGGQLLQVERIGQVALDVVYHSIHPGGVLETRGLGNLGDHLISLAMRPRGSREEGVFSGR